MGLEKLGMSLAEKTSTWVKTFGKTSVLQTKPNVLLGDEFILPLKFGQGEKILRYIRKGEKVGEIRYNISRGNIGKYPDYYLETVGKNKVTKPSVFISHLEANKCGAELMKCAAKDAQSLTNGRMLLDAQSVDRMTSPDAFYYKLGFRKLNSRENDLISEYIQRGEKIPPDTFSDRMYLPIENLQFLLNYKKRKK